MLCPSCAASNQDANRYCERCGEALPWLVCSCGHGNPQTARFCGACGAGLKAPAWLSSARERARAERKQVTVLFADIVGSTQLISRMDPEDAVGLLAPALAFLCETVGRFKGVVVRTLGDGVMALFGAPKANDQHALLACAAALEMQEILARRFEPLKIRVGIHSGEVVSGGIDANEAERQVHGAAVHLASRMEQIAEAGSICLSSDSRRLVHSYCETRLLGRHSVKGFADPVEIYRLLGMRPAVASDQFRASELCGFVGRDVELAILDRALQETAHGRPRVLGVSAGPGVGKSRLCYEFAELTRARQIPVFEARALPYGHAMPFRPVLDFLRAYLHITPADTHEVARKRVRDSLLGLDKAFENDLAIVEDFLGIADKVRRRQLDPATHASRLHDMFRSLVRKAGQSLCLIIVEDLHWLDAPSGEFLERLVDAIPGTQIMLVVNFRPGYAAPWLQRPYCERLELVDLAAKDALTMVQDLVGDAAELDDLRRQIAERSGGNPFFAEELVRSLAASGALTGRPGRYSARIDRRAQLPGTVQSVIGARIDQLSSAEKTILEIAAIIGKEFSSSIVVKVSGLHKDDVSSGLDRLCVCDLVQPLQRGTSTEYAFRHPLTHEVAYGTQLRGRRAELHAAVAQTMEDFYSDRLDEFSALLAYHWEEAGRLAEAATYTQRAATWVGKTDSAQALKHWRKLRELLQSLPRSGPTDLLRMTANGQILNFGWREGVTAAEARPLADEALGWARDAGNVLAQMLLLAGYGRIVGASGAADEYVARVKDALSLAAGAQGHVAMLNALLSQAYCMAGLFRDACSANSAALEGARHIDRFTSHMFGFDVEHWILCLRGQILLNLGSLDEAEEILKARIVAASAEQSPVIQYISHAALVELARIREDAAMSEHHARHVAEIAERTAMPFLRVCASHSSGIAKMVGMEFDKAAEAFESGLALARRSRAGLEYEARMLADLAESRYLAGDNQRALATARAAMDISRQRTARLAECRAALVWAASLAIAGRDIEEAAALRRRAEDLIRETGVATLGHLFGPAPHGGRRMRAASDAREA